MGGSKRKIAKLAAAGVLLLFTAFWFSLPDPLFRKPLSVVLEDNKGQLLGAAVAADGQWRFPPSDSVPEKFRKCITVFEDRHFYFHPGVDLLAIGRALKQNIKAGKVVSGGSTITMQVMRMAGGGKRTVWNKLLECIRAVRLELSNSKNKILALYAANAPFGSNVVGLEAASWRYFGRRPDQLSWGETASLAVLPNSPAFVNPAKNRLQLLAKRNRLIDALRKLGILNLQEAQLAKLEPVPQKPLPLPQAAPHLLNLARKDYNSGILRSPRVKSTLDYQLQRQTGNILKNHYERLTANGINNICALVLDVETGGVLVYLGNIYRPQDKETESHVDIIQSKRSPGSTLKPILYASMLNEGMLLPNSLIPDIPTVIAGFQPNNYDLGYDGAVPASKALARSLNVPAVRMLQQYRYQRFYDVLKNVGISTLNEPADFYGLSLILGGCEVSMWDLASVYANMARRLNHSTGKDTSPSRWEKASYSIQPAGGETEEPRYQLSPAAIWLTFQAMREVARPGEEQLWQQFTSSQQIAWKTGTSFGFRDAWAIGVTPHYVVAVWAGNADGEGRPGLTGIDAAAPVMFDIFRILPGDNDWFSMPAKTMIQMDVCAQSGFRASPLCTRKERIFVPPAALKAPVCPWHQLVHLDKSGKWQVTDNCELPSEMQHRSWFILPPAMEYYYKMKNYSYVPLPPFKPGCDNADALPVSPMELIYPKNNARIFVPREIDGTRGQVIFNAAHHKAGETIFWSLDNKYVGSTSEMHQMALSPPPGLHHITLIDREGNRLEQTFTILNK